MPSNPRTVYSTDPEPEDEQRPTAPTPSNPAGPYRSLQRDQPVIVAIERKGRGGKTVSILQGVASPPAGKAALLKQLKRQLGTGGTLKADTLEIQGDRRDEIVVILTGLGFKAKKSGG